MNNIIVKLGLILLLGLVSNASFAERTTTYMHSDALGSVIAASDEDGNLLWRKQYQPFGSQIEGGNESEEVSYTGKKFDKATGLSYYGARYYDPHMGRFTSVDPVGVLGSVESNPMMFNRYAYANNNPYKYNDPDGNNPKLIADFALNITFNYLTTGELNIAGAALETASGALNPLKTFKKAGDIANIVEKRVKATKGTKLPNCELCKPNKRGNAPTSTKDGHPIELHHRNQKPDGPLDEMTRTDHRLGDNFKKNHPNTGQSPSKIDRNAWRKEQKDYWRKEWDSGRFDDG